MVIDLVTFQVLEPYSKTDRTLLLNIRTLMLFGNELFLQIGDNIPKTPLVFLTLLSTSIRRETLRSTKLLLIWVVALQLPSKG